MNDETKKHPVDALILDLISQRPRSQAELQHASPLSDFGTIYRLLKLTESGVLKVTRSGPASTIYSLAAANENENKEGEVGASPERHTGENDVRTKVP